MVASWPCKVALIPAEKRLLQCFYMSIDASILINFMFVKPLIDFD